MRGDEERWSWKCFLLSVASRLLPRWNSGFSFCSVSRRAELHWCVEIKHWSTHLCSLTVWLMVFRPHFFSSIYPFIHPLIIYTAYPLRVVGELELIPADIGWEAGHSHRLHVKMDVDCGSRKWSQCRKVPETCILSTDQQMATPLVWKNKSVSKEVYQKMTFPLTWFITSANMFYEFTVSITRFKSSLVQHDVLSINYCHI